MPEQNIDLDAIKQALAGAGQQEQLPLQPVRSPFEGMSRAGRFLTGFFGNPQMVQQALSQDSASQQFNLQAALQQKAQQISRLGELSQILNQEAIRRQQDEQLDLQRQDFAANRSDRAQDIEREDTQLAKAEKFAAAEKEEGDLESMQDKEFIGSLTGRTIEMLRGVETPQVQKAASALADLMETAMSSYEGTPDQNQDMRDNLGAAFKLFGTSRNSVMDDLERQKLEAEIDASRALAEQRRSKASEGGKVKLRQIPATQSGELGAYQEAIKEIDRVEKRWKELKKPTNPARALPGAVGGIFGSKEAAEMDAELTAMRAPVRKALAGTAVSESERKDTQALFPEISSTDTTAQAGFNGLRNFMKAKLAGELNGLRKTNFDVSGFTGEGQAGDLEPLPEGVPPGSEITHVTDTFTIWTAPDGAQFTVDN